MYQPEDNNKYQSQFRLAIHLQKLYDRLKDYEPQVEYSARLDQIARAARGQQNSTDGAGIPSIRPSRWRTLMDARETKNSLALTRRLTNHESALELTTPKGFMLHGEVGTGKSMLIDLFADCLPTRKKRRWHFNTFMLETFSKLEALRRSRTLSSATLATMTGQEEDYSLLWLAKEMVQESPILFLDEFQMPDRVASKILTNLMTSFFHLGGVLVATSNRMPEELAKAAGMDFPLPAPSKFKLGTAFSGREFWSRRKSKSDALFGGQNEFAIFLDVLKARCEVWEMGGGRDYRRLESGGSVAEVVKEVDVEEWMQDGHEDLQHGVGMPGWPAPVAEEEKQQQAIKVPKFYCMGGSEVEDEERLATAIAQATGQEHLDAVPWTSTSIRIYGREIPVPRICNGVTKWTFDELCQSVLGPADYISLASISHTVILTEVPVLTWLMKNEARRFITLLDALYECRCKLFISAAAGPDELFFPDQEGEESVDSVYSETISDVYQDATAPFRPNILGTNPNYVEPDNEPDYTHARLAGKLAADALEDDPPNKPSRGSGPFSRSFGRSDGEMERKPIDPDDDRYTAPSRRKLDFSNTTRFTGEDERFAYKRAQSRLWEMCGTKWWAREEEGWHRPLPVEARRWERLVAEDDAKDAMRRAAAGVVEGDVGMGQAVEDGTRDERSFRTGASSSSSPFRNSEEPPPNISWTHIWGTMKWGEKAGKWGRGVEGLKKKGEGSVEGKRKE
ncbi:hypothetical protein LTR17_010945 [Elasticomyces elasticus]|nr:hypothetical protein LTR17_010945 [Elasticomyces elasticus]